MSDEHHQRVKDLFLAACELAPDQRAALLKPVDPDTRRAVLELLDNDAAPLTGLDGAGLRAHIESLLDEAPDEPLPERIGPYRVIARLGAGGMGTVYEAEQDSPRRRVALKVMTAATDPAARRRFEHEAQALARLRHPAIAQVYEAGAAPLAPGAQPVPYIAIELVDGVPIDAYARDLSVAERLELLATVCDAVHHAHQKGVIHRDLKPANILVEHDPAGGRPRILDFGIARIVDPGNDRVTRHTRAGQILGTLGAMSPEQVGADPDAIDTRTDVYALGALAYEMLTGHPPHDLAGLSLPQALRLIAEHEPPPAGALDPRLKGDVETIVARAMERDPQRRYQSAAGMADDIRRHLRDEPIFARPASTVYQLGKFARRHRPLVAAAAGIALVLVAASAVSSTLAVRESAARRLADRRSTDYQREAAKYKAVLAFLTDILAAADPAVGPAEPEPTIRQALAAAASRVARGDLAATPEVDLAVKTVVGNTYRAVGELDEAARLLDEAVRLGRDLYPQGHADLALAINKLARLRQDQGDLDEAEPLFREALAMHAALAGPESEEAAVVMSNLGWLRSQRGDQEEAATLLTESLRIGRATLGDRHGEIATRLNNLAVVRAQQSRLPEAADLLRQSLDIDIELKGEQHPNVATTMNNLGYVLRSVGRPDEAADILARSVEVHERMYAPDHAALINPLVNLAGALRACGRPAEAEPVITRAGAIAEALGDDHPSLGLARESHALVLIDLERPADAEPLARSALAIAQARFGNGHARTLTARHVVAAVALEQGRTDEALALAAAIAADAATALAPDDVRLARHQAFLARCLLAAGRPADAHPHAAAAHALLDASPSAAPQDRDASAALLADITDALASAPSPPATDPR